MQHVLRNLRLSPNSAVPDHVQIAQQIEQFIRTGALEEGARIPPTLELVRCWGVNISRIQRAMEILTLQGLLQRFPRRGTFVVPLAVRAHIGILVGPDLLLEQSHFNRILATALRNEIKDKGLNPRIYDAIVSPASNEGRRSRNELIFDLGHQRFNGFVVTGGVMTEDILPRTHRELPVVVFSTTRMQVDVRIDSQEFLTSGIHWLIDSGCQKPAFICNYPADAQQIKEIAGARGVSVSDNGFIDVEALALPSLHGSHASIDRMSFDGMARILKQWRRQGFFPDGILIPDDIVARGVAVAILAELGDRPAPKLIVQTTEGVEHFYALPTARYLVPGEEIARRLLARLSAKIIKEPVPSGPELVKGRIVDSFR